MIIVLATVTNQMLIFSDRHLRSILAEDEAHSDGTQPVAAANSGHRSPTTIHRRPSPEPVRRRPALGGLINEYEQAG